MFLDDDGSGNIRLYYVSSGARAYSTSTQGTIDYSTGEIVLSSLNVASMPLSFEPFINQYLFS